MELIHAFDEFMLSQHTITSYSQDFRCLLDFLTLNKRSTALSDMPPGLCRRFIQHEILNRGVQTRTIQRRISFLKSFRQYCLKERMLAQAFTAGIQAPKHDSVYDLT